MNRLREDSRFQVIDGIVALSKIAEPLALIGERNKRSLAPLFRHNLTAVKLIQEGRRREIQSPEERELDWDIRIESRGEKRLESLRPALIQDFLGNGGINETVRELSVRGIDITEMRRMADLVSRAWNLLPRRELGGRSPVELGPAPSKSRQKVARNDPCPCGSGKKYKKCCIDVIPGTVH